MDPASSASPTTLCDPYSQLIAQQQQALDAMPTISSVDAGSVGSDKSAILHAIKALAEADELLQQAGRNGLAFGATPPRYVLPAHLASSTHYSTGLLQTMPNPSAGELLVQPQTVVQQRQPAADVSLSAVALLQQQVQQQLQALLSLLPSPSVSSISAAAAPLHDTNRCDSNYGVDQLLLLLQDQHQQPQLLQQQDQTAGSLLTSMLTGAGTSNLMLNAMSGSALDDSVGLLSACGLSGGTASRDNLLGVTTGYSSAPVGSAVHALTSQHSAGYEPWSVATTSALRAFSSDVCYNSNTARACNPTVTQQWYSEQALTLKARSDSMDHQLLQQLSVPADLAAGHGSGACLRNISISGISVASMDCSGHTACCNDAGRSRLTDASYKRASASDISSWQGHALAGAGAAVGGSAGLNGVIQVHHRGRSLSTDTVLSSGHDQHCRNTAGGLGKASSDGSDWIRHHGLATGCAPGWATPGWTPKAAPAAAGGPTTLPASQDLGRLRMPVEGLGRAAAGAGAGTGVFIPPALRPRTTGTGCFLPAAVRAAAATTPKPSGSL